MTDKKRRLLIAGTVGAGAFALLILLALMLRSFRVPLGPGKEVDAEKPQIYWETLALLDFEKAIVPDELRKYDKQIVEIPGFAVPLEDDLTTVLEFLLVPNGMACIHAPPPPPNQMILVEMKKRIDYKNLRGPLWVTGELKIIDTKSKYGSSTYEMKGLSVRPYQ